MVRFCITLGYWWTVCVHTALSLQFGPRADGNVLAKDMSETAFNA